MRRFIFTVALLTIFATAESQVMKRSMPGSIKAVKKVVVYEEGKGVFAPSGWMGDTSAIAVDANCPLKPKNGKACIKWTYDVSKSSKNGWAGVYWQYPANNWGNTKGQDLTGHKKLSFWVRGDKGGEVIDMKIGGITGKFADTVSKELKGVKLSSEWKQYVIDLSGRDLSNVIGGFCWAADSKLNSKTITFYFDDIVYE